MRIKVSKDVWNTILSYLPADNQISDLPCYITYNLCRNPDELIYHSLHNKSNNIKVSIKTTDIKQIIGPISVKPSNRYAYNYNQLDAVGIILKSSTLTVNNNLGEYAIGNCPVFDPCKFDIIVYKNLNKNLYHLLLDHINEYDLE